MNQYAKLILMVIAAGGSALVAALSDNRLTQPEVVNVVLALLGAAAVFTAPQIPGAMYTKWVLAAAVAAATTVLTFLGANGTIQAISLSEWIQVGLTILAALGVAVTKPVDVSRLRSANPALR